MYLKSISDIIHQKISYSDHLDHQKDIRAKLVTYAIFGFLGPYKHYTCHSSMVSRNRSTTKASFGRTLLRYTFLPFKKILNVFFQKLYVEGAN
jgi:hypothetical protein